MKKRAVIALGGNALVKQGQKGTINEQFANTRESTKSIVKLIKHGWDIVITHGNGPQVGAILIQNKEAAHITPPMPLGICVAKSQGFIGYMIQQCIYNSLQREKINKSVVALITQVIVDPNDPALSNPTKPIGPYYSEHEAKQLEQEKIKMKKTDRGWRMVVPSPDPTCIVEADIIKKMLDDGIIVIATGGGGMPVIDKKGWGLDGVEVVVDKDLASERLASAINADLLLILTDVEKVFLSYNKPQQKPLDTISLNELKKYYQQGHFAEGSMAPKILSAIRFLESGGQKVIISHIDKGWEAVQGKTGTHIVQ
ncbi:MAG: carbamate kinase [Thermoplasmatota archaeon]